MLSGPDPSPDDKGEFRSHSDFDLFRRANRNHGNHETLVLGTVGMGQEMSRFESLGGASVENTVDSFCEYLSYDASNSIHKSISFGCAEVFRHPVADNAFYALGFFLSERGHYYLPIALAGHLYDYEQYKNPVAVIFVFEAEATLVAANWKLLLGRHAYIFSEAAFAEGVARIDQSKTFFAGIAKRSFLEHLKTTNEKLYNEAVVAEKFFYDVNARVASNQTGDANSVSIIVSSQELGLELKAQLIRDPKNGRVKFSILS